ncbi:uncharacterized protein DUF3108 [Aliiruegeria haliotis]|uniref:Uncharacterized protein DUF3108 n=1 Tax=Aliiruegeria haliotis TaxID=1280846 RepID=A0A2T0RWQ4_9RHOB|nr:DUF3108 domain-containing protein [Aliiruegeria haliotis]PRY25483.1 uncharacterized protein DUF3108 [Aliiruegeria haliotis]
MRRLFPILFAFLLPLPTFAEEGTFSVSIAGIGAGTIAFRGNESGGRYKVNGQVASTGLARSLYPARVKAAANGSVSGNRYRPSAYAEEVAKRSKTTTAKYRYRGGVPSITKTPPDTRRKSYHADPAGQGGTVDPLTTAYAILRDRPAELACALDISPYDGRERTRIRMNGGKRQGERLVCPGTYSRIAGFSDEDMAEKVHWPFSVTYRVLDGGVHRVEEVRVPTTIGAVVLRRR